MSPLKFWQYLIVFYVIVMATILALIMIPNKISCDSDNACAYDNAYLKCGSLIKSGECDEGTDIYLNISFCSLILFILMTSWGVVSIQWILSAIPVPVSHIRVPPRDINTKFLSFIFSLLIAALGIGAASMRYVLLTDFYKSKQ